jgi:hypothetical protein
VDSSEGDSYGTTASVSTAWLDGSCVVGFVALEVGNEVGRAPARHVPIVKVTVSPTQLLVRHKALEDREGRTKHLVWSTS